MLNRAVKNVPARPRNSRRFELPATIRPGIRRGDPGRRWNLRTSSSGDWNLPHQPRNVIPARIQSGMVTRLTTEVAITTRRAVAVSPP
jgi:hypothetical protein